MIPKIIHYCWFGGGTLPESDKKNIESWRKYCPDYQIIEWNEENYDITSSKYMKDAYDKKKWGFVPDFARFDIVYKYGGFYFDTDVEIVKSLNPLLGYRAVMGFEKMDSVNGGHGFGAEPGNDIIKELRDMYFNLNFILEDGKLNLTPSPVYITKQLQSKGLNLNNTIQNLGNMTVLPTDFFCPLEYDTGKLRVSSNTFSIHWFNASWLDEKNRKRVIIERKIKNLLGHKLGGSISDGYWKICRLTDLYKEKGSIAVLDKICSKVTGRKQ
ncbi:glycosyltransferase family 32 protein [Candidatus Galacturonibacter soehngenii]|uniref:Glycosyl transferase n=1 Tax=Candidatus Galacturonatibacter soehngenii TaxID=2307010 RepID=A0A7V7UBM3_9FIRM|nr:glycosyltransferase [Candidatus Galacturonibacter soehngenii]KAB1438243.1 glycosyl transferase [Candidatus Galacturonibacter soehngenii]